MYVCMLICNVCYKCFDRYTYVCMYVNKYLNGTFSGSCKSREKSVRAAAVDAAVSASVSLGTRQLLAHTYIHAEQFQMDAQVFARY